MASPAVAAPSDEAGTPSSNTAGAATSELKMNERNGSFDLQSHRGGRGEWTEESLAAFTNSLALDVTTLQLDTHLTEDGKVIVWHDDTIQAAKCQETAPAAAGDPEFLSGGSPPCRPSPASGCSPPRCPGSCRPTPA
ncbi:glycerophosphoryl diester phosphodiesterase family protein [Arthrobacter sp. SLBN-100]|uniref:glycerophosphodiester phosphodiesterase family protein n=1 Tax=Arthrobacter sp. SLBN-100 TaxID=2768450 RepID=UPI001173FFE9|nr:glycerophosphodiester phosphodiesterase family protein [Arthrobacter sp. SLBN-100]TQJ69674.1 glycerophosphoryl diester phosphodiesterase family protein [Arthrobacter sp. SLBN-100]